MDSPPGLFDFTYVGIVGVRQ